MFLRAFPNREDLLLVNVSGPAAMVSGGGTGGRFDVLKDARLLGAVATIAKPFEREVLMDLVARSLAGAP